jgi:hypothetical protein
MEIRSPKASIDIIYDVITEITQYRDTLKQSRGSIYEVVWGAVIGKLREYVKFARREWKTSSIENRFKKDDIEEAINFVDTSADQLLSLQRAFEDTKDSFSLSPMDVFDQNKQAITSLADVITLLSDAIVLLSHYEKSKEHEKELDDLTNSIKMNVKIVLQDNHSDVVRGILMNNRHITPDVARKTFCAKSVQQLKRLRNAMRFLIDDADNQPDIISSEDFAQVAFKTVEALNLESAYYRYELGDIHGKLARCEEVFAQIRDRFNYPSKSGNNPFETIEIMSSALSMCEEVYHFLRVNVELAQIRAIEDDNTIPPTIKHEYKSAIIRGAKSQTTAQQQMQLLEEDVRITLNQILADAGEGTAAINLIQSVLSTLSSVKTTIANVYQQPANTLDKIQNLLIRANTQANISQIGEKTEQERLSALNNMRADIQSAINLLSNAIAEVSALESTISAQ